MTIVQHKYTEEELAFIRSNEQLTAAELARQFNELFGTSLTKSGMQQKRNKMGITVGPRGRFKKGGSPWNKGVKGSNGCGSPATQFKKGHRPKHTNPIGHERVCPRDGFIMVKVVANTQSGGKYRPKHHVEWEKAHGPIPKGHVIKFLDGNRQNTDPSNLCMVPNAVHKRMDAMGWKDVPMDAKATLKLICQIEDSIARKDKATTSKGKQQ